MTSKKYNAEEAINEMRKTNLWKNGLKRYLKRNDLKIKNKTELQKAITEFENESVEAK